MMMNKILKELIGDIFEVYMDDMIIKFNDETNHTTHLEVTFEEVRRHNMLLNPNKCTFDVKNVKVWDSSSLRGEYKSIQTSDRL